MGAELLQGYHLDKPLPITALVERWLGHPDARAAVA
jgi:EAL domain-containing protein (putative c-di-GMP-specific phosphodiesterase class I)